MIIKICEFCKGIIKTRFAIKRFCNSRCQGKNARAKDGAKEKMRVYMKEYRKSHPQWKIRHRILAVTRHREKRANYWKEYGKRPEFRARVRRRMKLKRETDLGFVIPDRIRRSLNHALSRYSKNEKIMSRDKYGINLKEIIEHLKPFPENLKNFEIDHIIPLHTFNLTNPEEVKRAFAPSNLQWLTREENGKKSGKLIILEELPKNRLLINNGESENASMR